MAKTISEAKEIGWNVLVEHLGESAATLYTLSSNNAMLKEGGKLGGGRNK